MKANFPMLVFKLAFLLCKPSKTSANIVLFCSRHDQSKVQRRQKQRMCSTWHWKGHSASTGQGTSHRRRAGVYSMVPTTLVRKMSSSIEKVELFLPFKDKTEQIATKLCWKGCPAAHQASLLLPHLSMPHLPSSFCMARKEKKSGESAVSSNKDWLLHQAYICESCPWTPFILFNLFFLSSTKVFCCICCIGSVLVDIVMWNVFSVSRRIIWGYCCYFGNWFFVLFFHSPLHLRKRPLRRLMIFWRATWVSVTQS